MRQLARRFLRAWAVFFYRRKVRGALALHRRGEARADGLALDNIRTRLQIRWRARDVHPWDRHLPGYQREVLFADQALRDTESTILRLFQRLPHVDVIELAVLDPGSEILIAEGTVHRSDLTAVRHHLLSVGMRLRDLGIRYRFATPERHDPEPVAPRGQLYAQ